VYHFPALIKQPVWLPPVKALRKPADINKNHNQVERQIVPEPENTPVGDDVGLVVVPVEVVPPVLVAVVVGLLPVVVGAGLPDFGRYFMPVEGQLEVEPEGATGTNVPDLKLIS
jgi:hypothetical protein